MGEEREDPRRAARTAGLIAASTRGDRAAEIELDELTYEELRRIARAQLARVQPGESVAATALVHEAWMALTRGAAMGWRGRRHFFGSAARAMREVLFKDLRRQWRLRHGGAWARHQAVDVAELELDGSQPEDASLDLHAALAELARDYPRKAEVVDLRFFAGLSNAEIARALELSVPTVERDWCFARAWLARRLGGRADG